jgi:hypothetical protein
MRQTLSNGARAAISRSSTPSSHTRPTVRTARPAETAGWSCGFAFPAVGWPALTIHRISTPKPTTKRLTTLSPFRCGTAHAYAGATSINARSDVGSVEPVQSGLSRVDQIQTPDMARIRMVSAHSCPRCPTTGMPVGHCIARPAHLAERLPRRVVGQSPGTSSSGLPAAGWRRGTWA